MAKFCGQCGAQLNDNATFCTQCGATIAPQQPAQQTASPMANLQQAAKNIDMNAIKDAVSVENIKNLKNKPNKLTGSSARACYSGSCYPLHDIRRRKLENSYQ